MQAESRKSASSRRNLSVCSFMRPYFSIIIGSDALPPVSVSLNTSSTSLFANVALTAFDDDLRRPDIARHAGRALSLLGGKLRDRACGPPAGALRPLPRSFPPKTPLFLVTSGQPTI